MPERLIFDGSNEQCGKGNQFMKHIRQHDINYHITEPDLHNQNLVRGVICELCWKWYRIMIQNCFSEKLWDYGLCWVLETSNLTYSTARGLTGHILLTQVTGKTVDISKYLNFAFYDQVWFKDNAGSSLFEPVW